jgi:hypothetical protein
MIKPKYKISLPNTNTSFTQEEKEMILGKAACKVLGL